MVTYTPAGKISPFGVQFLTELDPILEAAGVREVFLNLPHGTSSHQLNFNLS
jgi:hypothetical protein